MEAIVLGLIRHTDRASILRAYTRTHGRVNYMVYGRSSRRQPLMAMQMPLSEVEITSSGKEDPLSGTMPTLKEISLTHVPHCIPNDLRRQSVALFIAEILASLLVHPMADEQLYDFLRDTIADLDESPDTENVHLRFLHGLCMHLGVAIDEEQHPELFLRPTSRHERQQLLGALCAYLEQQMDGFRTPKSLDVLMELFD